MAIIWANRAVLIKIVLIETVTVKSEGELLLSINNINYYPFEKKIKIFDFNLIVKSSDSINTKQTSLQRLSFDSVVVSGFSLRAILFEKRIKAEEILTAKPEIVFSQKKKNLESHNSIQDHFNSIHPKYAKLNILPIEIDVLKVKYGNVIFKADSSGKDLGSADFSVELHQFNTLVDSLEFDSHSFLFSRRLIIDIDNFSRVLKNNNKLTIDKLEFDSKFDKLTLLNLKLGNNNSNLSNRISLNQIEVNGLSISEINSARNLKLMAVKVSDGHITLNSSSKIIKSANTSNKKLINDFFHFIDEIEVDSLLLSDINIDYLGQNKKKIASVKGLKLLFLGLYSDSSYYQNNILPSYKSLDFGVKSFIYDSIQQISGKNITYSSDNYLFELFDINVVDTIEKINLKFQKIIVDGLDSRLLLKKKPSNIVLILEEPEFNLNISSKYFKKTSNKKPNALTELIKLEKVVLKNANLSVFNNLGLTSAISNLNLSLNLDKEFESSKLNISNLKWNSGDFAFTSIENNIHFEYISSAYENNFLHFENGKIEHNLSNKSDNLFEFAFEDLSFRDFNLIESVNNNSFKTSEIIVQNPNFNMDLRLNNSKNKFSIDSLELKLPLTVNVNKFILQNGDVKLKLVLDNKQFNFVSELNVSLENIIFPKEISFNDIEQIILKMNLENASLNHENSKIGFEEFNFNSSDSSLSFKNLNLNLDSLVFGTSILYSNKLTVSKIDLTNLDYFKFIKSHELSFNKLEVIKPDIDIYSYSTDTSIKKLGNSSSKKLDFSKVLFKVIELQNLKLLYNFTINDSKKRIRVNNFDFEWNPQSDQDNLLMELSANINGFQYFDSSNNSSFEIEKLFTDIEKNDISIVGGQFVKPMTESQNGIFVRIPLLDLNDIVHSPNQSYNIEIKELRSDSLILKFNNKIKKQKPLSFSGRVEALEKYSNFVSAFNIKRSSFHNIDLSIKNESDSSHNNFSINEIDVFTTNVGFSTSDSANLHLKELEIDIKRKKFITADSLYEISSGDIYYNFAENYIGIDSFYVKPRFNKDEFFKKAVYQTDIINVQGRKILFSGIDFQSLLLKKELIVSNIDIEAVNVSALRNKKYPFKHGVIKPLPAELIRGIKQSFFVDTISLVDSYVLFGEYVEGSEEPGTVHFTDISMTINHFSNMPSLMNNPPVVKVAFQTKIMGNSLLTSNMEFPIHKNEFSFNGKTEQINFKDFNSMTQNLFGVSIKKGIGYFDIKGVFAGDSISKGSLIFHYKDLRVGLYDREKAQLNKGMAAPFFSFLVNDLLVRSNNPRFFGRTRMGLVYFERNKEKSFLNYIWKSLLSGMLSTMWHNSKEQRKEKKRIKTLSK